VNLNNRLYKLFEDIAIAEPLQVGDKVAYKGQYMSISLPGVVKKVLPDDKFEIEYTTRTGKWTETTTANKNELTKTGSVKVKPLPKEKHKEKYSKGDYPEGTVIKVLPDNEEYVGEYGVIVGSYENSYIIDILSGEEPRVYIPKQYVEKEK
jgi:ribosomal protein L21E